MDNRESFGSRLGFILVSAGCAIGIGNVWRFPYITGKYGGAAFVLIYLIFLILLGLPVMTMEFAVGRASKKSIGTAFSTLKPDKKAWSITSWFGIVGNYMLMMYYTTVSGWMLCYIFKMAGGEFKGMNVGETGTVFNDLLASPVQLVFWMLVTIAIGFIVCSFGLQNGVEKVTKPLMVSMFILMFILCIRSLTLPGGEAGLKFYLVPDLKRLMDNGIFTVISAAMGQAFFTLSIGMGSMLIFGSYITKEHTLTSESITVIVLDTAVAIMSGLIIFPACYAYNVDPGSGPGLVFVTLPEIFIQMSGGRFWGTLFFIFMCFASISTVIAVFENIIAICMDKFHITRKRSITINACILPILSIPAALGFNVLSSCMPFGEGSTILDLEDFIVSNNILPIGAFLFVLFCTCKFGWGFDNFMEEANTGKGLKFHKCLKFYLKWILPIIIGFIFFMGYKDKFFS